MLLMSVASSQFFSVYSRSFMFTIDAELYLQSRQFEPALVHTEAV